MKQDPASSPTNLRESALDFIQLVASGKVDMAFQKYVANGFRHHNPFFAGDANTLREAMRENAGQNPDKRMDIQRVMQDGNLVAIHSHIRQYPDDPGAAVVHIFRFENGKIAELWDIAQGVPDDSPNRYGMF